MMFKVLSLLFILAPWFHGLETIYQSALFNTLILCLSFIVLVKNPVRTQIVVSNNRLIVLSFLIFLVYCWAKLIPLNQFHSTISHSEALLTNLKTTTYLILFLTLSVLLTSYNRVNSLSQLMIISASANCIYGLINHYTGGAFELSAAIAPWGSDWSEITRGTFSYKNHYASYIAMNILIAIGLLLSSSNRKSSNLVDFSGVRVLLYSCSILLMFFTLVKTGSRGGFLVFSIVILSWFFLILLKNRKKFGFTSTGIAISVFFILASIALTSATFERLSKDGLSAKGRDLMHNTVFSILKHENSLVGSGPGAYPLIQHKYKQAELGVSGMSRKAHSDYLELLVNYGLFGAFLLFVVFVFWIKRTVEVNSDRDKKLYFVRHGYLASLIYLFIHSAIDFNVSLPSLVLSAIVGVVTLLIPTAYYKD